MTSPASDAHVRIEHQSIAGLDLRICAPFGDLRVRTPMIGSFNAMNLLQAALGAWSLGASPDAIARGIETFTGPPGRLQRVCDDPLVLVDFAHTDDALRATLDALRATMTSGRLIVVFGCGGDRDRTKRPRMGDAASRGDLVLLTSDNPRTEDPLRIIDDVRAGMDTEPRIIPDRRRAIHEAIALASQGDAVLIAGKGHERQQILADENGRVRRIAFDDVQVATEALSAHHARPLQRGHA